MNQHTTPEQARRKQVDWTYGWRLFEAGQPMKYCTNKDQQAGWNGALNACCYAQTNAFLRVRGIE